MLVLPKPYPLIDALTEEIHSRSFPKILGRVCVSNVTVLHNQATKAEQLQHLQRLADHFGVAPPQPNTSCYYQDLGDIDVRWEFHTEFSTYTFIRLNNSETAFTQPPWQLLPEQWCQSIPGLLLSATHIDVQSTEPDKNHLHILFDAPVVAASLVADKNAQIWASFQATKDGFDRILLVDLGLSRIEIGRLLRCVLELSSYRMTTLLSVPVCKNLLPQVANMEQDLADITLKLSDIENQPDNPKGLLTELSSLSAALENLIADNQVRIDASKAYRDIVEHRICELKESRLAGLPSLGSFLRRRLEPAVKTGCSLKQRMLNLSNRIEKASDLLLTNINLSLEEQNQILLKALNRRSHIQLRMHQLVESVSMIAISYYLIQLIGYVLVLPQSWLDHLSKEQAIAICVPVVVLTVWLILRKFKHKWIKEKSE